MKYRTFLRRIGVLLVLYGSLVGFLWNTDPTKLPAGLLLVPFGLLFASLYATVYYGLLVAKRTRQSSPRKRALAAFWLTSLPMFLLLLQSIHQLTWRDSLLFSVFVIICILYTGRANFLKR